MPRWNAGELDALIFDMDDTLYPEREYVLSGFRAVAAWAEDNLGIPATTGEGELRGLFEAGVRGDTFNRWVSAHGLAGQEAALIPRLVAVYREHEPEITPFPGVRTTLAKCRRHYRLGLVSDGYLAVQRGKFRALGLRGYFDAVVFSDEWGRAAWKPSVKPFVTVLEKMGVAAGRAVYIADNPVKDFLGAKEAGMGTIWLRQPAGEYSEHEPVSSQHAAEMIVDNWKMLERVLLPDERTRIR